MRPLARSRIGSSSGALHHFATHSLTPTIGPFRTQRSNSSRLAGKVIRVKVYKSKRALRPALDRTQDLIVFLTQLVGGRIFYQRVSERKHYALDAQPVHEADQLGHPLFRGSSRCRSEMAVHIPDDGLRLRTLS